MPVCNVFAEYFVIALWFKVVSLIKVVTLSLLQAPAEQSCSRYAGQKRSLAQTSAIVQLLYNVLNPVIYALALALLKE